MKKLSNIIFLTLACLSAASCMEKEPEPEPTVCSDILFSITAPGTKAGAAASESAVNEWSLYICNSAGTVVDCFSTASSTSVIRSLPSGTYSVYALANAGLAATAFSSESQILSYRPSLVSNSMSSLVMYGKSDLTVSGTGSCTIPLVRVCAKVEIHKVSLDFSSYPDLAAQTFTLKKIYLINVAGDCGTESGGTVGTWYNKRGYTQSGADALIYEAGINASIASGTSYTVPHYFYCLENLTPSDTHAGTWSPRRTRLVLECTIGGATCYYPVTISGQDGKINRNNIYSIENLIIRKVGTDSPDSEDFGTADFTFNETVAPWGATYNTDESI